MFRRFLAVWCLPLLLAILPAAASFAVLASLPSAARDFYLESITRLDQLILALGSFLFVLQTLFAWRALTWKNHGFDERADSWISHLSQAAEWFPLLGLLGTVAGILQTFSSINGPVSPERIIQLYGPAITATGSGIFMALVNILPAWFVLAGRDLILGLAGGVLPKKEDKAS